MMSALSSAHTAPASILRAVVIEDDQQYRTMLRELLPLHGPLKIIGDAHHADAGVELCRTLQPNIVLLDHTLPTGTGTRALSTLQAAAPRARIAMLSAERDPHVREAALKAGADAWYDKTIPVADLAHRLVHLVRQ